jgi:hypothetical protein
MAGAREHMANCVDCGAETDQKYISEWICDRCFELRMKEGLEPEPGQLVHENHSEDE